MGSSAKYIVNGSAGSVNVRLGPNTSAQIVGQLPNGTEVEVAGTTDDFSQIVAYMKSSLLQPVPGGIVPLGQRDPRWKSKQLGNDPTATIGEFGCLLTDLALIARMLPDALNALMVDAGLFQPKGATCGACVASYDISAVAPHVKLLEVNPVSGKWASAVPQSGVDKLIAHLTAGHLVILECDFDIVTSKEDMHFILGTGMNDDGTIALIDPWPGKTAVMPPAYGASIASAVWRYIAYGVS